MFPSGTTTGRIMTNAGKTRSVGGEISLGWNPVEHLDFTASYGYTDARFVRFFNGLEDFSGRHIPYAPQNTLFIQVVYELGFVNRAVRSLTFEANLKGTGKIYWNESNTLHQGFYCLPGASVALEADKWQIRVFGTNLSDARYHTFYFQSIGNEFLQRGKPWQIGVSVSAHI